MAKAIRKRVAALVKSRGAVSRRLLYWISPSQRTEHSPSAELGRVVEDFNLDEREQRGQYGGWLYGRGLRHAMAPDDFGVIYSVVDDRIIGVMTKTGALHWHEAWLDYVPERGKGSGGK